jgi:hypothetical protein
MWIVTSIKREGSLRILEIVYKITLDFLFLVVWFHILHSVHFYLTNVGLGIGYLYEDWKLVILQFSGVYDYIAIFPSEKRVGFFPVISCISENLVFPSVVYFLESCISENHVFLRIMYFGESCISEIHVFLRIMYFWESSISKNHVFLRVKYV